jgi:hypothetical protein
MLSASVTAQTAPTAGQLDSARRALANCELHDPAALLSQSLLDELNVYQGAALYASKEEAETLDEDQALVASLRRNGRYDMADVYATYCRWSWPKAARSALAQLRVADPIVSGQIAFAPLLTGDYEYFGSGLVFVQEAGVWRLSYWEREVLGSTPKIAGLVAAVSTRIEIEDYEAYLSTCIVGPAAPMLRLDWHVDWKDGDDAPYATLGAAQRLAALRHAQGRSVPRSTVAQLILAEVLIRSVTFADAPEPGSARWLARIARAERLLAAVDESAVDWTRLAPVLLWLARGHAEGNSGLPIDPMVAQHYTQLVNRWVPKAAATDETEQDQTPWRDEPPAPGRMAIASEAKPCQ